MKKGHFYSYFIDKIEGPNESYEFSRSDLSSNQWKEIYFNWVLTLKNRPAVYVFSINNFSEIIYIGMAGKINSEGVCSNWSIRERLKAYRGKSKDGKHIRTHDFIRQICIERNLNIKAYEGIVFDQISTFEVDVYYPKINIPAAFLEASFINEYFNHKNKLPKLNLSF
jgi:hypothetical protein